MSTYWFEVRETTVRDAHVEASSITEARSMMRAYREGAGDADMGGDAPIQLGDMRTIKLTFRLAQVDRSQQGGDHEDGRHAEHESAVAKGDAP